MSGSMAGETVALGEPRQVERRALDVLPSKGTAEGNSKVLTRDLIRLQAVQAKPRHSARGVPRHDPQAQPIAPKTCRMQGAEQIGRGQHVAPRGRSTARL